MAIYAKLINCVWWMVMKIRSTLVPALKDYHWNNRWIIKLNGAWLPVRKLLDYWSVSNIQYPKLDLESDLADCSEKATKQHLAILGYSTVSWALPWEGVETSRLSATLQMINDSVVKVPGFRTAILKNHNLLLQMIHFGNPWKFNSLLSKTAHWFQCLTL